MVGFEPTDAINVNGFQDRLFKPLRHISIFAIPIQFWKSYVIANQ